MNSDSIQQKIFELRDEKIMLDFDLALLYEVGTKVLNQSVKRNRARFPQDFMFQLTGEEWKFLQLHINQQLTDKGNRSQIVTGLTGSLRNRNKQYLPFAFTEHGVTMLASILRSEKAVEMNIIIVRAFIALRQIARQYKELAEKLAQLENTNNKQFKEIYQALNYLIDKKQKEEDFSKRQRIGFHK